jgi:integration host factor subunit alpha
LEKGETLKITGFGNFVVLNKKSRPGRNPKTGERFKITPRKVISFRASPVLKQVLNKNDQSKITGSSTH